MRGFLAILALLAWSTAGLSQEQIVKADGTAFAVTLPQGFCALSRTHPQEKTHYDMQDRMQSTSNGVLTIAVHCSEIDAVRKGEPWKRWVIWLLNGPPGKHTRIPPDMPREVVVKELVNAFPSLDLSKIDAEVGGRASQEGLGLKLKTMSVIANDTTALYTAQAAEVSSGAARRDIAVVTGWGSMAGHLLTLNCYEDFKGQATVETLLAQARDVMSRAMAANDATAAAPKP